MPNSSFSSTPPTALIDALRAAQNFLCISHVGPDGDAVGSLTGMGHILRALGKSATLALQDAVPDNVDFLPGVDNIVGGDQVADRYDAIICLDASSKDRMGSVYCEAKHGNLPLLVIDHHVTNTEFGSVNWVAPECVATCQMLVYLAEMLDVPLAGALAECLLAGLVTDTMGFRTSNTTAEVLDVATRLMRGGANLARTTELALSSNPYRKIALWGRVLGNVQLAERVIWCTVRQADLDATQSSKEDVQLASFLASANEADIGATMVEKVDESGQAAVECSFRAKPGFDVSGVALAFGGGGHPPAAGCTVMGELETVTRRVVEALQAARREQAE